MNQPKMIFDLPPGGLCTLTEVFAVVFAVCVVGWLVVLWGARGWGAWVIGLLGLICFEGFTG